MSRLIALAVFIHAINICLSHADAPLRALDFLNVKQNTKRARSSERNCSTSEIDAEALAKKFLSLGRKGLDMSRCPLETWLESMRAADPQPDKLFINIGFNKGYNFAIWMNLFAPWTNITPNKWFLMLDGLNIPGLAWQHACGVCSDCFATFNVSRAHHRLHGDLTMIGVDLNGENVKMVANISHSIESTADLSLDRVNLLLINGAGSEVSGTMNIPFCTPGLEDCNLPSENVNSSYLIAHNISFKEIPLVTVEEIVSNLKLQADLPVHIKDPKVIVDILMIDTEGHDPLVLQGARPLLRENRIRCIVFEYHVYGRWPQFALQDVVNELDGYGLDCFFQGQGRLWSITGCFWNENYEFHFWSNVMCVRRDDVWRRAIRRYIVTSLTSPLLNS